MLLEQIKQKLNKWESIYNIVSCQLFPSRCIATIPEKNPMKLLCDLCSSYLECPPMMIVLEAWSTSCAISKLWEVEPTRRIWGPEGHCVTTLSSHTWPLHSQEDEITIINIHAANEMKQM